MKATSAKSFFMFQDLFQSILFAQRDPSQIPVVAQLAQQLIEQTDETIDEFLQRLTDFGDDLRESGDQGLAESSTMAAEPFQPGLDKVLIPVIQQLVMRELQQKSDKGRPGSLSGSEPTVLTPHPGDFQENTESPPLVGKKNEVTWTAKRMMLVEQLYRLSPVGSDLRNHFLQWLAICRQPAAIQLWVDLICDDPPHYRPGIGLAFFHIIQAKIVFNPAQRERLLNWGTAHSQIAPAIFELFNYFVREQLLTQHPALPRLPQLSQLLGEMCHQMVRIESGQFPANWDAGKINQQVSDSVALIVALCDLFALTEYSEAIPHLREALQLRHRRVQTEAAAALARLQDQLGKRALIALAEQPVARLRVLAYAEELGFKHEISLELQGEIAQAEAQLAIWLAEPAQMGLAPSKIELIDHRELFWPSFERPIPCYLFRYSYGSGEKAHCNIGISGPLTHAFPADLRHLPLDEVYAAFAGWQAVHHEIYQMSPARAQQLHSAQMRRLERGLDDESLEDRKIQTVGSFFGQIVLVATARCEGVTGTLIVDDHDSTWFEAGNPEAPVDWKMAYTIWRGKQLLARFNQGELL